MVIGAKLLRRLRVSLKFALQGARLGVRIGGFVAGVGKLLASQGSVIGRRVRLPQTETSYPKGPSTNVTTTEIGFLIRELCIYIYIYM